LFPGNYGVGIGEDEVGSGLGFEVCPTIIVETKFNENDSKIGIGEDEVGSGLGFEVCPTIIVETKFNENDSKILTIETQARQEQLLL
jgi:hypothetical protein